MKKTLLLCMAIALTSVFNATHAQSNKELSAQYKHEINVLNQEIKTVKLKLKGEPKNPELSAELVSKQAQLKEVQSKKKIVDNAIKSSAAAEKATKKAESAVQKADKAAKDAQKRAEEAQKLKQ